MRIDGTKILLAVLGAASLSCGSSTPNCGDNVAGYAPHIDPKSFSTTIDNQRHDPIQRSSGT